MSAARSEWDASCGNRYRCFSLAVVFSAHMAVRIHKGVIWLLVATVAEVIPAVSD